MRINISYVITISSILLILGNIYNILVNRLIQKLISEFSNKIKFGGLKIKIFFCITRN